MKKYLTISVLARIITALLLIWALEAHPYSYYKILRWITAGVSLLCLSIAASHERKVWTGILAVITVAFNPIVPLHLAKATWAYVDLAAAIILLVSVQFIREPWGKT